MAGSSILRQRLPNLCVSVSGFTGNAQLALYDRTYGGRWGGRWGTRTLDLSRVKVLVRFSPDPCD
jgi:hypothetical protein